MNIEIIGNNSQQVFIQNGYRVIPKFKARFNYRDGIDIVFALEEGEMPSESELANMFLSGLDGIDNPKCDIYMKKEMAAYLRSLLPDVVPERLVPSAPAKISS